MGFHPGGRRPIRHSLVPIPSDAGWKAAVLNLGWFSGTFIVMLFYLALTVFSLFPDLSPWWFRLLLIFLPFLLFQGVLHYLLLKVLFPVRHKANVISAVVMPFLLVAGFVLLVAVNDYMAGRNIAH